MTTVPAHIGSEPDHVAPPAGRAVRTFDGVICFGGLDWWYHNRGHYDMQMMHELSAHVPVLYVNSIGMRVPRISEGRMFFRRIARKLRSVRRGFVRVRDDFAVYSPTVVPGQLGMAVSRRMMARQVERAARKLGIRSPLLWIACPPAAEVIERLPSVGVVYQRTDRYEDFKDVDRGKIIAYDRALKDRALLTVFCSTHLFEHERGQCRDAAFIDHGVEYDTFAEASDRPDDEPDDVCGIPRPRAGFIGAIDAHTFDPALLCETARMLPDVQFVMVGGCTLEDGWCTEPNVHLLGRKPYEDVARYMAACDVLIMPWNTSPWIKACNPVKLKEYLAVGRGIVSTWFDELHNYEGLVRIASDATSFAAAIRDVLADPPDAESIRDRRSAQRIRVQDETWRRKGEQVLRRLCELGVTPEPWQVSRWAGEQVNR